MNEPSPGLYTPTRPARAERWRPGMTELLGRPVATIHGFTSVHPHTLKDRLHDGCWAVEQGERFIKVGDQVKRDGFRLAILTDADFRARWRLATG